MFNISQYLEKFKNVGQNEKSLKQLILVSVKEVIGMELNIGDIVIKNGELIFKVSPAVKNTIFIKKGIILDKIKEKSSALISDIR